MTGIWVDDYIMVDFGGFKDMVDAGSGGTVCIPEDIDDDEDNIHSRPGPRTSTATTPRIRPAARRSTAN